MRVLHEDLIDRIKASAYDGPTAEEWNRRFDGLQKTLGQRIDVLEIVIAEHERELQRRKRS